MSNVFGKIKNFFKNVGEKIKEGWKKVVDWFKKDGKNVIVEVAKVTACIGVSALVFAVYKRVGGVFSPAMRIIGWIGVTALSGVLEMATERYIDGEVKDAIEFKDAMTDMVEDGFDGISFAVEE